MKKESIKTREEYQLILDEVAQLMEAAPALRNNDRIDMLSKLLEEYVEKEDLIKGYSDTNEKEQEQESEKNTDFEWEKYLDEMTK